MDLGAIIGHNVGMLELLEKLDLLLNLLETFLLGTVYLNPLYSHRNSVVHIEPSGDLSKRTVSQDSVLLAFDGLGQAVFLLNFLFHLNLVLIILLLLLGKISHLKILVLLVKLSKQFLMDQLSWVQEDLRFVLEIYFFGGPQFCGFVSGHPGLE